MLGVGGPSRVGWRPSLRTPETPWTCHQRVPPLLCSPSPVITVITCICSCFIGLQKKRDRITLSWVKTHVAPWQLLKVLKAVHARLICTRGLQPGRIRSGTGVPN